MPYDTDMVVRTAQPYNVFRRLREPDYATNIAKDLETSQQTVSEIIGILKEDWGLVEVAKRKRATYYVINYDSIFDAWERLLEEESSKDVGSYAHSKFKEAFDAEDLWQRQMPKLISRWTYYYTDSVPKASIKRMLLDDFFLAVKSIPKNMSQKHEILALINMLSEDLYDIDNDPKALLTMALTDLDNVSDEK